MPRNEYRKVTLPSDPTLPLSIEQAAKLLTVSIGTIRNAMADGLPYQRISERVIRLSRADVLGWGRTVRNLT